MKKTYQKPEVLIIGLLPQNNVLQASLSTEPLKPTPNPGEWESTSLPIF